MAALSSVWVVLVVLALLVMAAAHDGAFGVGLVRENLLAAAEEAQVLHSMLGLSLVRGTRMDQTTRS